MQKKIVQKRKDRSTERLLSEDVTTKEGKRPQKVYLGIQHITGEKYGNFKYSPALQGVICVPCALFAGTTAENRRGKFTSLGYLVNKPLSKYTHLTGSNGYLTEHLKFEYHKTAICLADGFLHSLRT